MANLIIVRNNYMSNNALENVVNYVKRYSKTSGNVGAQGVMLYTAYECMYKVQKYFCQTDGKKVQHFILSFDASDDIESVNLMNLGYAVCALFPEYQLVFGIHNDTDHIHIHWALNPVNMITGSKLSFTFKETYTLRAKISELLEPYNIPCNLRIDKPKVGTILIVE